VCENEDRKQAELDAGFKRRVAQEFEVQAGRLKLWWCRDRHASGHPVSRKKKKVFVGENPPMADADAQDHIRERKKDEEPGKGGRGVARALLLTRVIVVRSVPGSDDYRNQRLWRRRRHSSPTC
jgi:hypothetical protein